MNEIERHLEELERKAAPDERQPVLVILPETTKEEAKAGLEKQIGRTMTRKEFEKMWPSALRVVVAIHMEDEILENPWISPVHSRGLAKLSRAVFRRVST
jgi:hypothetical protein